MALEQWVPRAIDQKLENPSKTIQLSAEGVIFETWTAPFPDQAELIEAARAIIASIADESPKNKRVGVMLTAFGSSDGAITSQCATSCIGKNAAADSMIGAGGGTAKAFADAMIGIVATMNSVNKAAKDMLDNAMRANDSLTQQLIDQREFTDALQEEVVRSKQTEGGMNDFVVQQLKDAGPLAMEAFGLFLESHKNKAKAAQAVVNGINQVSNGAIKS